MFFEKSLIGSRSRSLSLRGTCLRERSSETYDEVTGQQSVSGVYRRCSFAYGDGRHSGNGSTRSAQRPQLPSLTPFPNANGILQTFNTTGNVDLTGQDSFKAGHQRPGVFFMPFAESGLDDFSG